MDAIRMSEESQTSSARSPSKKTGGHKRWTPADSRFFLQFMASQVVQGLKVDKGFKPQAIHAAIRALREDFGVIVTEANVANHLRTIKKRWVRIKKLKELSGMGWDNSKKMIIMGDAEYRNYIKIHPQDEPLLNKPIEDHDLLETVCGNDQATGSHAMQFGDPIGTEMDYGTSQPVPSHSNLEDISNDDINEEVHVPPTRRSQSENMQPESATPTLAKKGKGKRKASEETLAIKDMSSTIKEGFHMLNNRSINFAQNLSTECLKLSEYGFSDREINKVYDYLIADDSRAKGFIGKAERLRKIWTEEFLEALHNQGEGFRGFN